jgi:hypothetical protein
MKSLYILGAGSSRNYAQSTHTIPNLKSPLDHDFFKMARLVIENTGMKSDPSFMEEIEHLIVTVAPMYGSKDDLSFFDRPGLGLEEVMTLLDIDFKLFSQSRSGKPFQYESRQTRILKDLLARTLDYALTGPLCKKHMALAKNIKPGDLVLSFNYDILMDDALYHYGKLTDSGYGMNFFKTNEDGTWIRPNELPSGIALLKLHGSLNWTRCAQCGALVLYRYKKQVPYGAMMFQCPRCSSDDTYAQRMMIPPTQSKEYSDRDIGFLWIQADRMMREISRIVCVGYSFPTTDFDMLSLMRRFKARQPEMPEIDFVSPDSAAEKRLEDLLGVGEIAHFKDLSTYLDSQ